jgi:hypothetical protein
VGSYGTELTDNDYLSAWQKLATAGAITEGAVNPDVACLLSVESYAAALRTERFINRDYNGDAGTDALKRAKVGTIYGSDAVMSNLLNVPSASQHACGFFHKERLLARPPAGSYRGVGFHHRAARFGGGGPPDLRQGADDAAGRDPWLGQRERLVRRAPADGLTVT